MKHLGEREMGCFQGDEGESPLYVLKDANFLQITLTVEVTCYDWCTIKILLMGNSSKRYYHQSQLATSPNCEILYNVTHIFGASLVYFTKTLN